MEHDGSFVLSIDRSNRTFLKDEVNLSVSGRLSRTSSKLGSSRRRLLPNEEARLERQRSGAARGLDGLRFVDKVMTGKEVDAWIAIEKRFQQFSAFGRLPVDENINFHKIIALAIAIGTIIHTAAHMGCNFIRLSSCPVNQFRAVFGGLFVTQPSYMDLVISIPGYTGIIMIILMAISFTFATSSFRRNVVKLPHPFNNLAGFTSFWYTHHLLIIVYFLFIAHGTFLVLTVGWYRKTVCHLTTCLILPHNCKYMMFTPSMWKSRICCCFQCCVMQVRDSLHLSIRCVLTSLR